MAVFLISVAVIGLALLAMSVGVMAGREPIKGSCGGVAGRCALCSGSGDCEKKHARPDEVTT
jgi:hypothetical protein